MILLHVLFAVFSFSIAACTALYFYLMLWQPTSFYEVHRTKRGQWKNRPYLLLIPAWFGTGYMIYAGALAALSWIPHGWIVDSDDGPVWVANSLAFTIATTAGLFVMGKLEETWKKLADHEAARRQL